MSFLCVPINQSTYSGSKENKSNSPIELKSLDKCRVIVVIILHVFQSQLETQPAVNNTIHL